MTDALELFLADHWLKDKGGTLFSFGNERIDVTNGRELVRWKDFFSRLEDAGFIEIDRYNQQGNPVYQLRQAAYDYIDSFEKQ